LFEHLAHGIDDLDSIVPGWVVAGSDHDTNGLAAQLPAPKGGQQANPEGDALEEV
jgi:hypothetical protein